MDGRTVRIKMPPKVPLGLHQPFVRMVLFLIRLRSPIVHSSSIIYEISGMLMTNRGHGVKA